MVGGYPALDTIRAIGENRITTAITACIQIVRKITFATSVVCKGTRWRTNASIE